MTNGFGFGKNIMVHSLREQLFLKYRSEVSIGIKILVFMILSLVHPTLAVIAECTACKLLMHFLQMLQEV